MDSDSAKQLKPGDQIKQRSTAMRDELTGTVVEVGEVRSQSAYQGREGNHEMRRIRVRTEDGEAWYGCGPWERG